MQQLFKTYGMTLYNVSQRHGVVEKVQKDLFHLQEAIRSLPTLRAYLKNPTLSKNLKKGLFRSIESHLTTTHHWLALIIEKKRAQHLADIIAATIDHFHEVQGREEVHVTAARPLNATNMATIERIVDELLPKKEASIAVHTDETIIGGYILEVGERRLDASLKRQLQSLRESWQRNPTA